MMNLEDSVSNYSWARVVDYFVDLLPLEELGFTDVLNKEGRPPFHSSDLLKLYMYGYRNGIRSSTDNRASVWYFKTTMGLHLH